MKDTQAPKVIRWLAGYYGVLQSLHLLSLARAGWLVLRGGDIPFPAPPPPGGWPSTSLPFLLGMGMVDVFAITLGLVFVYKLFYKNEIAGLLGVVSLTIALSSGVVYLVGTIPSGAWQANWVGYLAILLLFGPVVPFFILFVRYLGAQQEQQQPF
jgi:hypothetical protein